VRLAAVRRLAYEAADSGLLSPELAAGIRRVKGVKKLGVRLGKWLTAEEARRLWQSPGTERLKAKRDRALLAVLLGCGLRRRELAELTLDLLQRREDHWAIVDLVGKGGHIRTVPIPDWVKQTVDDWLLATGIVTRRVFRCVCRASKPWGDGMTERVVWHVVKEYAAKLNLARIAPTTFAGRVPACVTRQAVRWSKSNSYSAMCRCKRRKRTLDASSAFAEP
jgi:site-specific recombinase XerD